MLMEKPQKVELHIGKHRVAVNFFITPDPPQKDHPFLFGMKWPHKLTYVSANHIPTKKSLKATLAKDKRTIKIQYPFSAKQASRLITKIKIEIDPQYISKMGNLNILEWPDKNLERIVFHKDS